MKYAICLIILSLLYTSDSNACTVIRIGDDDGTVHPDRFVDIFCRPQPYSSVLNAETVDNCRTLALHRMVRFNHLRFLYPPKTASWLKQFANCYRLGYRRVMIRNLIPASF
jgi:hypothetical protein